MIDWREVPDSTRITHEAYSADEEKIYVRFPNGVEWWYGSCSPDVWEEFTSGSRGSYIHNVLNHKSNGQHAS